MKIDRLQCIIAGQERGGTTVFGEVLKNHPKMTGAFECGMLMWENPSLFINDNPHWDVFCRSWFDGRQDIAEQVCSTTDFNEACNRLHAACGAGDGVNLFYKSPEYMKRLSEVMARCECPAVIVQRDPRALFWSRVGKGELLADEHCVGHFSERYRVYVQGLRDAQACYGDRILVIQLEDFCADPVMVGREYFDFIGLDFKPIYVQQFPKEYTNYSVHGKGVDPAYCYLWKGQLDAALADLIMEKTEDCREYWRG